MVGQDRKVASAGNGFTGDASISFRYLQTMQSATG